MRERPSASRVATAALRLIEFRSARDIGVLVGFMWLAVFVLDMVTGNEISVALFYLLPISVVALRFGSRAGTIASLLGAATWFTVDRLGVDGSFNGLVPLWNGLVRFGTFLVVSILFVAVRALLLEQRQQARIDLLTGVLNSRGFRERAEEELERVRRSKRPLSVAYIDVDHFKRLNDTRGHSAGDDALRQIGDCIHDAARRVDVVGRLGGDEFALVLPETSEAQAHVVVHRVRDGLAPLCSDFDVDVSIGVVTFLDPPPDVDTALRLADELMYQVKAEGRGSVRFATHPAQPTASAPTT